jgi:hypothetical protein
MQTILEKRTFKENGKLSKLFCQVLRGLNLPAGSDTPQKNPAWYQTPQNKTLRGIRPCRTKSCGVSDPAEQWQNCVHFIAYTWAMGSDTLQNNVLGSDIPLNKVLRGIRSRGTKSCGVSNPVEQHSKTNISANSKKNSKII